MDDLQAKRVALYARYSSDRQSPRSIEDQLRVCREYVARRGGTVAAEYTDAAISGTSRVRPGLQQLEQAVASRAVDVVVCEDLSRIGRNAANTADTLEDFKSIGARLIAIQDGIDTGEPGAAFVGAIKGVIAAEYVRELGVRTKRGLDGRFDAGQHTGGRVFGYRSVPIGAGGKRLDVDPAEAAIVVRIFDLYVAGHTQRAISELLNAEGLRSPRGGRWTHTQIRSMLRSEVYAGVVTFNRRQWTRDRKTGKRRKVDRPRSEWRRRERPELRVVDPAAWHAAQDKARAVSSAWRSGARPRTAYPLSGLLVCDACGEQMILSGGARRYYQCGGRRRGIGCGNRSGLREQDVRRWLLDQIRDACGEPTVIADLRSWWAGSVGGRDQAIRAELGQRRAKVSRIESQLSKLLDMVLDTGDTPSTKAKRADLEDDAELQRATCARLEHELQRVPVIPSPEMVRAFLTAVPELALRRPAEVRALLGDLLDGPARCSPPAPGQGGYRVRCGVRLEGLMTASATLGGGRSTVVVAGAGFAYQRAPRLIDGVVPVGYGGRP